MRVTLSDSLIADYPIVWIDRSSGVILACTKDATAEQRTEAWESLSLEERIAFVTKYGPRLSGWLDHWVDLEQAAGT